MLAYFCALVKAQFNKTHRRKLVKLNKKCGNKLGIYPRKIQRKIKNSINSCAVMIDSSKIVSYLQGQLFRSVKQIGTPDRALSGVPICFTERNSCPCKYETILEESIITAQLFMLFLIFLCIFRGYIPSLFPHFLFNLTNFRRCVLLNCALTSAQKYASIRTSTKLRAEPFKNQTYHSPVVRGKEFHLWNPALSQLLLS